MKFNITNCNSIDTASIELMEGSLNIKYGPNGTGKSTIARAIELAAKPEKNLSSLEPFKYRGLPAGKPTPGVLGADALGDVFVFNEAYVNQFVFQQDEILKNSFEVFVKSPEYSDQMKEIEILVKDIKDSFDNNASFDEVIKDMSDLTESFGKSSDGFSKAGRLNKAYGSGNKIENIPPKLAPFAEFIKSENNVKWIKWQIEGNLFSETSASCPYCTSPTADKKEVIKAVSTEYDAKSIEHLNALQALFARLGKYFSPDTLVELNKLVKNKDNLSAEGINFLKKVKGDVETFRLKLTSIKSVSFFSLRDAEKVQENLLELKIDLGLLAFLKSPETEAIVAHVNNCLDAIVAKAGELQGKINKQKAGIEKTIAKYKGEINNFLRYAGYRYNVDIILDAQSYKMKLRHTDFASTVENGSLHLSYGERNAFALVLFMYECLTRNPGLTILDDPISSFDKTKKFAILEMLFRGKNSLRGKTVLMLTHDIEPIIDLVKSMGQIFQPAPNAYCLSSKAGAVNEQKIEKSDISTFSQVCLENIASLQDDPVKIIYLRRYYEILNDKGMEYQVLSSLLHKRPDPITMIDNNRLLTPAEIAASTLEIQKYLQTFDYVVLLGRLTDKVAMKALYAATGNAYEKLQLFRIINDGELHDNNVIKKYINETYHIENEFIMQLNPRKFDLIPEYIIRECDLAMN